MAWMERETANRRAADLCDRPRQRRRDYRYLHRPRPRRPPHHLRRGGLNHTSGDTFGTTSTAEPKTDWRRLRSMTDEEVREAIVA